MEIPVLLPEGDLGRLEILNKVRFGYKAYCECEEKIVEKNCNSASEATILACNLFAYETEHVLNFDDYCRVPENSVHLRMIIEGMVPGVWHRERRGKLQKAIKDAQAGDFKAVRSLLVLDSARFSEFDIDSEKTYSYLELSRALLEIAKIIPESGEKYKLPVPAWMDPRFNPDASPLPVEESSSGD